MSQFNLPAASFRDFPLLCALCWEYSAHVPCLGTHRVLPQRRAPDVIIFTNGDQLTGKLLREVNGSVTFHSDIAGDVTVTWDKIKSIHSSQQFAVIQQGQHVTRKTAGRGCCPGRRPGSGRSGQSGVQPPAARPKTSR